MEIAMYLKVGWLKMDKGNTLRDQGALSSRPTTHDDVILTLNYFIYQQDRPQMLDPYGMKRRPG
jgi:hypothetical protein